MITINNIHKSYKEVTALNNILFSVNEGEIFGLIGPDGAGKTTLFRILTTLLLADSGEATVCGYDVVKDYKKIRNICGYMPGRFSLYQDLSVEENLNFFATLFNTTVEQNYHLIKDIYCQIEPFKQRRAGDLSGGMKQKLALSCALIHCPKVLFLDEPTTGVDPLSRVEFWEMLGKLKERGITILVSTPYMDEAEKCSKMVLMRDGEILANNTPEGIKQGYKGQLFSVKGENMYPLLGAIREWRGTESCFAFGDSNHLSINEKYNIEELNNFLENKGFSGAVIERIEPTIEDCFMTLSR